MITHHDVAPPVTGQRFGIEHEVALADQRGDLVAWTPASAAMFTRIIDSLPDDPADAHYLYHGTSGKRVKRWYIEGVERMDGDGQVWAVVPKGIEIRTTPQATIAATIREVDESFALLRAVAAMEGLHPIWISVHPTATAFVYDPPLNAYERAWHAADPDAATAAFTMLTYGPDLNLSRPDLSPAATVALGMKLTALSPFIIPFSFSAPVYAGARWPGLSARTYYRTGRRPAVRVYVPAQDGTWPRTEMIRPARLPNEVGRIEFKACDSCADLAIYAGLLALLKGLVHDRTLLASAAVADVSLHQRAARWGFDDPQIRHGAQMVLQAAGMALADDPDAALLAPLWAMLGQRTTPAHAMIARLNQHGSITEGLRPRYTLEVARSQPRSDRVPGDQ